MFATALLTFAFATQWNSPPVAARMVWAETISNLIPRYVGPVGISGRVSDIAVFEKRPKIFYVASASGGVWKTDNDGVTFKAQFTHENISSLGAIAVSQTDPNLVWLGTGEPSSRNSVGWGNGVYKSTDGGDTWRNCGLKGTISIGKIVIDPRNDDVVYVAALGNLWGPSQDRGIYKTIDGGRSWKRVISVDEQTGFSDLVIDPSDPNTLLAASWQRLRKPWNFQSEGPGGGIWKTTDGGKSWRRLTNGLPHGSLGRIGLNFSRSDAKEVVATVEHVSSGGVYISSDKGESWSKVSSNNPRPFYFSIPRIDPNDAKHIYLPGITLETSEDGGLTFRGLRQLIHSDFHAFWIDPADSDHMLVGEDGGLAVTYDGGNAWRTFPNIPTGQFYEVSFDLRRPYWVYGGLQDNGCWSAATQTLGRGPQVSLQFNGSDGFFVEPDGSDWRTVYQEAPDGGISRVDQRTGLVTDIWPGHLAKADSAKSRFNWNAPYFISPHLADRLYLGANVVYRSEDRGDTWQVISPDLTTNDPRMQVDRASLAVGESGSAESHCTITTLAESPVREGVIWCGTDDGQVQLTRDGGKHWTNVTRNVPGLPSRLWVSRIRASRFDPARAFLTVDGHRSCDLKPYVFMTENYGRSWTPLSRGLPPDSPAYVITEGTKNPDLLLVGTETSIHVSLDRGKSWTKYANPAFPTVPIYDLEIQPVELDLVVGTHGRSIWTINIAGLEQMTPPALLQDAAIFKPHDVLLTGWYYGDNGPQAAPGGEARVNRDWGVPNTQPGTEIPIWIRSTLAKDATVVVSDSNGKTIQSFDAGRTAGFRVLVWNGYYDQAAFPHAGDYKLTLIAAGKMYSTTLRVEDLTRKDEGGS